MIHEIFDRELQFGEKIGGNQMPTHDIIDNREGKRLDHGKGLLRDSVSAKFAVGSFFPAD